MKTYKEKENILIKILDALPIGAMAGLIILGIVFATAIEDNESKEYTGTYHDYNKAIIITGDYGTEVELKGYSHETLGHDHYILYTIDGSQYECTPENVVFFNE